MTTDAKIETPDTSVVTNQAVTANKEAESTVKLKDTDIKWRAKYKVTKAELEDTRAQSEQEINKRQQLIDNTIKDKTKVEQKLIDAKLESAAVSAGLTDLDLIKLIDKSLLKLTETGDVTGVAEAVQAFKQAKPNFFGAEKKVSSSTNAPLPSGEAKITMARDLSDQEYEDRKRRLLSGQPI